jgi:hypothetical protein
MTHKQIKHLAKEIAGQFHESETQISEEGAIESYDPVVHGFDKRRFDKAVEERQKRSLRFRRAFPKVKDYILGHQHMPDGSIQYVKPGWLHHVDRARQMLVLMLGQPDARVSPHMKEEIYEAILADHELSTDPKIATSNISQRLN